MIGPIDDNWLNDCEYWSQAGTRRSAREPIDGPLILYQSDKTPIGTTLDRSSLRSSPLVVKRDASAKRALQGDFRMQLILG
jgi:hypothetical protein